MKYISIILFTLFCNVAVAEIASVTVLDGKFQKLNKLIDKSEVSKFSAVWETKVEAKVKIKINWSEGYKIDISGGKDTGRWLYRGGWLMPLSKSPSGLYQIQNYKRLESVLGITHNKSNHADLVKLSPFLFQKSRHLHQSVVGGVKCKEYE